MELVVAARNFPQLVFLLAFPRALVLMGLAVIDFVAVIMIWMWKIMGFYLSVGVTAISIALSLIYAGSAGIGAVIFGIIGMALLYFAMRPVWKNFR
ncbi:MAG: hypothetical protein A3F31_03660 [Candidatus Levybacteria bacterium RIFCSPHIGHO2_12_FULL_38_12]|nr:MAG: hypothetical protein A3F31_03660 [Candidatus Levybacteria bacterium RIFCSPHIGHO2_12_FULL_38_12]OGH34432.1 MAG: hypothetical protein A3A47_02895 [Candidatus Levybacteria bacterium RIFCSPLOWO2_01_FULL_37_20]